jgi:AraC family ethanolamine operon transcriptional activator
MREHIDETITLLDLSRACGMRSRSLINAFEAITGLSPMDFLKRLRLSAVRTMLLRADARATRIIDVATAWGFWHMGHFAHDYRVMFGEAPSQTLLSGLH